MKTYDLILVVGYFRSATSFLSVVRALGRELRIAVLSVDADPAMQKKTGDAQVIFLDLCRKFGSDLLKLGVPMQAKLLIIQQFPYTDTLVQRIQQNLSAKSRVGLMTLTMAGLKNHDAYLEQFGINKVYVPNRRLMTFLLEQRGAGAQYEKIAVTEVGLPFSRYRVVPEFTADWIIAAPTLFSFRSEHGKQQFLQSVNKLLDQIAPGDVVVYKHHNGNSKDYFAPRLHYAIARVLAAIPGADLVLQQLQKFEWPWLRSQAARVKTCMLHQTILRRATPMSRLTPYAGLSLEAFLPGVRKGVIGGLSNTIWGTLYFDLPYYNCVDDAMRQGRSELINKSSDKLLDLNLQFFGIPYCEGELKVGARKQGVVTPEERRGDLVETIKSDLSVACGECRRFV
jgi:hypothetical protein